MIINQKFKGVFTSRDQACIQYPNDIIDAPINTAIVRWDIKRNKAIFYQNLTKSIITVLVPLYKDNFQYFMLCSYQGEISIIKSQCIDIKEKKFDFVSNKFNLNKSKLTFGTVSNDGNYLIACCEQSLYPKGSLNILNLNKNNNKFQIQLSIVVDLNIYFAYFIQISPLQIWVLDQPDIKVSQETKMKILEFNNNDNQYKIIDEKSIDKLQSYVYHISFNNQYSQTSNDQIVLYTFQSDIFIIDCKTNNLQHFIEKPMLKKCFIKYIIMQNNNSLLVGADSGKLIKWQKQENEYIKTKEYICPSEPIYYMNYYQQDESKILLNTISQFSKFDLVQDVKEFKYDFEFELNTLTNSACAISNCGQFSTSVDFSGNIFIWDNNSQSNDSYLFKYSLQTMIRSIIFLRRSYKKYELLVGNLEGGLYQIKLNLDIQTNLFTIESQNILLQLQGGIIAMDYSHKKVFKHQSYSQQDQKDNNQEDQLLIEIANKYIKNIYDSITYEQIQTYKYLENIIYRKIVIGTSEGYLCLLQQNEYGYIIQLVNQAHKPVTDYFDQRFGSLSKYAEIWSVCFSPQNQYIATSSEDQTAKIWDLYGNLIHTFVGHSTAVTSIDWQFCEINNKEIFITCGDDQKAIIWTLNEIDKNYKRKWVLNKLLETQDKGLDWHTLTYLKLFPFKNGKIYAILTTENGYIFICNIFTQEIIYQEKAHFGSIEGLDVLWNKNTIQFCTVSSDCTVGIFNIHQVQLFFNKKNKNFYLMDNLNNIKKKQIGQF